MLCIRVGNDFAGETSGARFPKRQNEEFRLRTLQLHLTPQSNISHPQPHVSSPTSPYFSPSFFSHHSTTRKRPEVTASRPIPSLHILTSTPTGEISSTMSSATPNGSAVNGQSDIYDHSKVAQFIGKFKRLDSRFSQTDSRCRAATDRSKLVRRTNKVLQVAMRTRRALWCTH